MSVFLLSERASRTSKIGIAIALVAMLLLAYQPPNNSQLTGTLWLLFAVLVFLMWGVQAYVMKLATRTMSSESLFFYMMITGVLLSPVALLMTDWSQTMNWGFHGPWLSFLIQSLNAVGALALVYAMRFGKAMVVSPLTALAPVITVLLSLVIYGVVPHIVVGTGLVLAGIAIYLLAMD